MLAVLEHPDRCNFTSSSGHIKTKTTKPYRSSFSAEVHLHLLHFFFIFQLSLLASCSHGD
jgi:hypothetical protein